MKKRLIRSALPLYFAAGVWAVYGLALPLYELKHILMATCLSVIAYLASGKFFPGREVVVDLSSGDKQLDEELKKCSASLQALSDANKAIASGAISQRLDRMEAAGRKILGAVAEKRERMDQVRKFMNYYLPVSAKLMDQYRTLASLGSSEESIQKALKSVEDSLEMIASAFEKQLSRLYKDEAMDVETDIQVLETMLSAEGLNQKGTMNQMREDTKNV